MAKKYHKKAPTTLRRHTAALGGRMKTAVVLIILATLSGCVGLNRYPLTSLVNGESYTYYVYRPVSKSDAVEIEKLLSEVLVKNEYIFIVFSVDEYIEVHTTMGLPIYGKPGQSGNSYRFKKVDGDYKLVGGPNTWIS